jgi:hypothetical protein
VPHAWVGKRVSVVFLDEQGRSLPKRSGWLRGASEEGIEFAQEFWSDSLKKPMPENARFYPWSRVGGMALLRGKET